MKRAVRNAWRTARFHLRAGKIRLHYPPVGGGGGTFPGGDDACARSAMLNVVTVGITNADAIPAFFSTVRRVWADS